MKPERLKPGKKVVHVLYHGRAPCPTVGFITFPKDWPPGHVWASFLDWDKVVLSDDVSKCPVCDWKARQLAATESLP